MPGFLLIFGFAALAGVFIILTLTRLPFGLGDFASTLVVVCFWLLVSYATISILHFAIAFMAYTYR